MSTSCEDCAHVEVCAIKKSIAVAMERAKEVIKFDHDVTEACSVSVSCKFFDYRKEHQLKRGAS